MKQIYFKPARQVENVGDLLINLVEVDLLREHGQIIVDDSETPAWFVDDISKSNKDLRLSSISQESLVRHLTSSLWKQKIGKEPKKSTYLVFQPGHTSRTGFSNAVKHFKLNLKYHLLNFLGCKIIRVGFSIGPFDSYNALSESFASRAYKYYGLRDQESLKIAKRFKFKNPSYFPDLAWSYQSNVMGGEEKYIVLSLRSNVYGTTHSSSFLRPILDNLKQVLRDLPAENRPTRIIACYQVAYDRESCFEIKEHFQDSFEVTVVDQKLTLDDACKLYSGAQYVISNRLHVLLLALQNNCLAIPFIDLDGNKKITALFRDNNLEDLILNIDKIPAENSAALNTILNSRNQLMEKFKMKQLENSRIISENLSTAFSS